ncbi:hypothetical protein [Telluribacter humicola]|uniref:hypothetical protein n=1 Tax=Telluribacter humicola TaxID=1720261 RepID=UPI001A957557|nr:hypothetical protein [Telluribacter humicola]
MKDIEANKVLQQNMEEGIKTVMPRIENELSPLIDQKNKLFRQRLLRLDELATELGVGKLNKDWFEPYMVEQTSILMQQNGYGDAELKAIFEKYSREPLLPSDDELADYAQKVKDEFGIEMNIKEMMEKGLETYLRENKDEFQQKISEKWEEQEAEDIRNYDPATKQKVSKQDRVLMQDAKTIYMRLVKKYHPDRELDEALKVRYTDIIQQVTTAYKSNDFLTLLKLQIEHLDEKEADATFLAEDMLKRYNKILQKQLNVIKEEVDFMKYSSMGLFDEFFDRNHQFSKSKFTRYKKKLKEEIADMEEDIQASYKRKKGWFKEWIREIKMYQQEVLIQETMLRFYSFEE